MKKFIICLCFALSIFFIVGCSKKPVVEIGESTKFSDDEINNAIECVKDYFNSSEYISVKIWYDEETSNTLVDSYLENGVGSTKEISEENVIVILSDFKVPGVIPFLSKRRYQNWQWTLTRNNKTTNWEIDHDGSGK